MLPAPPPTAPLTSQPHASPGPDTAGASAAGEIRPGAEYGATSQPVATPGPTPAGASAAGEVPSGADHGATLLPVGFPGPSPVSTSAAGEVSPRAQNGASSSTGVQAVSESPREAQDTGPSSQLEASPGEWKASTPVSDYVRPAVKLILDAEIRTDPQGPYGVDASYWEAGRHSAHIAMEVKGALESFTTRAARLSGRTRPTHSLELWEALGFTVQATELAARRVGGSPEKAAEISDNLGRSVSDAGVSDKGKRAETGAGASGPEESPQVELAPSDVTDYVSKRLQVLGAAAGDEGRSVLRPLAGAAKALRGASIPEQLFRARGLQILAGALLRGKSR